MKHIKKHWKKIFVVLSTISILLTATISASANGFTTTETTLIRQTSADFKSVSMHLPFIGGDRAYFYSNSGANINGSGGNQILNKIVPTRYNLMYSYVYDVYTINSVKGTVNKSYNEISHYIVPLSYSPEYSGLKYAFEIFIPFAVGGKRTSTEYYEQDYIVNITGGINEDIETNIEHIIPDATDLDVRISYHYAYVDSTRRNNNIESYYSTTGVYTRNLTVPIGQNFSIYNTSTAPDRDNYIILDTLITIEFTANDTIDSSGNSVNGAEQRFTLTTIQPLNGTLDRVFQSSRISRELIVNDISFDEFSFTEWVVTQLNSLLRIEIIWGVTIGSIMWFIIGISLFFFLMKVFLGG